MASPVVVSRIQNRRGTQDQFNVLYPIGYQGTGGYGDPLFPGFNSTNYPNVLLPGEIALCTDTRRVFMGNISGEYVEISGQSLENLTLLPLTIALPPAATFTVIPELTFKATPFFNIIYSITDDLSLNRNTPGTNFSRSGSLQVTSIKYVVTPAAATLTDMSSEINDTPYTITFMAEYDVTETDIEIKYTHDFPDDLTFSSSSLVWVQS